MRFSNLYELILVPVMTDSCNTKYSNLIKNPFQHVLNHQYPNYFTDKSDKTEKNVNSLSSTA